MNKISKSSTPRSKSFSGSATVGNFVSQVPCPCNDHASEASSSSGTSTTGSGPVKKKLTRNANFACVPKHEYAYLFDGVFFDNCIKMRENSEQSTKIAVDAVNKRFFNGESGHRDVSKHYMCPHFTHDNTTPCFISERFSALKEHLLTHRESYYYCYRCEEKFYHKSQAIEHFNTICNDLPKGDNGLVSFLIIQLSKETIESFKVNNPFKHQALSKDEFHMASLSCKKITGFPLPHNPDGTIDTSNLAEYVNSAVTQGNERKMAKAKKTKKPGRTVSPSPTKKRATVRSQQKVSVGTAYEAQPEQQAAPPPAPTVFLPKSNLTGPPTLLPKAGTYAPASVLPRVAVRNGRARIPMPAYRGYVEPMVSPKYNWQQYGTSMPFPTYQVTKKNTFLLDHNRSHMDARNAFLSNISKAPVPGPIKFHPCNPPPFILPPLKVDPTRHNAKLPPLRSVIDSRSFDKLAEVCYILKTSQDQDEKINQMMQNKQ